MECLANRASGAARSPGAALQAATLVPPAPDTPAIGARRARPRLAGASLGRGLSHNRQPETQPTAQNQNERAISQYPVTKSYLAATAGMTVTCRLGEVEHAGERHHTGEAGQPAHGLAGSGGHPGRVVGHGHGLSERPGRRGRARPGRGGNEGPDPPRAGQRRRPRLTGRPGAALRGAGDGVEGKAGWLRARTYWPAYDRVRFTAHLAGVRGANGVYGAADLARRFSVGASLVTVASASSHRMKVWVNGRLSFDWPISTGQPGDDTPDGQYLTIEKGNPVDMNSCSFGVCPGDPGYYNVLVYDSVRFTWSGDYVHSAPWSVGEQGVSNVSHGCVNLAPDHAAWYYDHAHRGEPVTVVGSPVRGTWGDGWTIWFLPWQKLIRGSALRQAVAAGPEGIHFAAPATLR